MEYDAAVRPELDPSPWALSHEDIDPDADIFAADRILTVEATGGAAFFGREETVTGLAPFYRFEVRSRTAGPAGFFCLDPATACFRIAALGMAVVQDRILAFEVLVLDDPDLGFLLVQGADDLFDLGPVDPTVFAVIAVEAVRDGVVTISYDGVVRAELLWEDLPAVGDIEPHPAQAPLLEAASETTVVAAFGNVQIRTEWDRVRYEICRPPSENVDVQVVSTAPSDPGSVVLRGGTGQTLAGFEQLHGTLTRVTALHRSFDGSSEGEIVLSDSPQDVTFLAATDDGTPRRFAAFDVPPGEVSQLRFHVDEVTLDLDGVSHDVRVGSGAQSGIKVIPEGGRLVIPEDETVSLAVDFDLTRSLSHNRGRGFMLDPVVVSGVRPALPPEAPDPVVPPDLRPPQIPHPTLPPHAPPPPWLVPRTPQPVISEVYPLYGRPDDPITIFGTNLFTSHDATIVTFGKSQPADIVEAAPDRLVVRLPVDATIASVEVRNHLGIATSRAKVVPIEPYVVWLPAFFTQSSDISELGDGLSELHVVGDADTLAFVMQASAPLPADMEVRVFVDTNADLRHGPGEDRFDLVLSSEASDRVGGLNATYQRADDHLVFTVPLSDLGPLEGENNGSFWYFLEVMSEADLSRWPAGPAAGERLPEHTASAVPWYQWGELIFQLDDEAEAHALATDLSAEIDAVLDTTWLDLGYFVHLKFDPELSVADALLAVHERGFEGTFVSPNWVWGSPGEQSAIGADFRSCAPALGVHRETYRGEEQYNLHLHRIRSDLFPDQSAHEYVRGSFVGEDGAEVRETVFVLDTGLESVLDPTTGALLMHADFGNRILPGFDAFTGVTGPLGPDPDGHGTQMAGVIAMTDGPQIEPRSAVGVAPEAAILPVRLACTACAVSVPNLRSALTSFLFVARSAGPRARVANLSQGMTFNPEVVRAWREAPVLPIPALGILGSLIEWGLRESARAMEETMQRAGVLLVIAAGNHSSPPFIGDPPLTSDEVTGFHYPPAWFAHKESAVVVAGTDEAGIVSGRSVKNPRHRFDGRPVNDLAAASRCIRTTDTGVTATTSPYIRLGGTSLAAAHVSGAAALLRAFAAMGGVDDLSAREVYDLLVGSAQPRTGSDLAEGAGILDVYEALRPFFPRLDVEALDHTADIGRIIDFDTSEDGTSLVVARSSVDAAHLPPRLQVFPETEGASPSLEIPLHREPLYMVVTENAVHLVKDEWLSSFKLDGVDSLGISFVGEMHPGIRPVLSADRRRLLVVNDDSRIAVLAVGEPLPPGVLHNDLASECALVDIAAAGQREWVDENGDTAFADSLFILEACEDGDRFLRLIEHDGVAWRDVGGLFAVDPFAYRVGAMDGALVVALHDRLVFFDANLHLPLRTIVLGNRQVTGLATLPSSRRGFVLHESRETSAEPERLMEVSVDADGHVRIREHQFGFPHVRSIELRLPFVQDVPVDARRAFTRIAVCPSAGQNGDVIVPACFLRRITGSIFDW